jgi:RimJ/RimL family protein N-acetyltransferase
MDVCDTSRFEIRNIKQEDEIELLQLRNDSPELVYFLNSRKVEDFEHAAWFSKRLRLEREFTKVLTLEDVIFGVGYLDRDHDIEWRAKVSINLAKKYQNFGLGSLMLKELLEVSEKFNVKEIVCQTHIENIASIKFFEKNGFEKIDSLKSLDDDVFVMKFITLMKKG